MYPWSLTKYPPNSTLTYVCSYSAYMTITAKHHSNSECRYIVATSSREKRQTLTTDPLAKTLNPKGLWSFGCGSGLN